MARSIASPRRRRIAHEGAEMIACNFPTFFHALWGYAPFPWQEMLVVRTAAGRWPQALERALRPEEALNSPDRRRGRA